LERAALWARRRPALAAMGAAAVVLLLAGTGVSAYFAVDASARAREAERNERAAKQRESEANLARDKAEDAFARGVVRAL
jgi:hypothetical protein